MLLSAVMMLSCSLPSAVATPGSAAGPLGRCQLFGNMVASRWQLIHCGFRAVIVVPNPVSVIHGLNTNNHLNQGVDFHPEQVQYSAASVSCNSCACIWPRYMCSCHTRWFSVLPTLLFPMTSTTSSVPLQACVSGGLRSRSQAGLSPANAPACAVLQALMCF